jgi:hypothetical protein
LIFSGVAVVVGPEVWVQLTTRLKPSYELSHCAHPSYQRPAVGWFATSDSIALAKLHLDDSSHAPTHVVEAEWLFLREIVARE